MQVCKFRFEPMDILALFQAAAIVLTAAILLQDTSTSQILVILQEAAWPVAKSVMVSAAVVGLLIWAVERAAPPSEHEREAK